MEIIEGILSLDAVFKSRRRPIHRIILEQKRAEKRLAETSYIKKQAQARGAEVRFVTSEEINRLATGESHGGILAFVGERTFQTVEQLIAAPAKFVTLLEGVEDPYNFGFAVRSLYCAGCDGLLLPERNWMSATSTVCRSSAGATEYIAACQGDVEEAVVALKRNGYKVICTDRPGTASLYSPAVDLSYPLLLVIGGEKRGISRPVLELADHVLRVEYGQPFPSALPTVSAAAVIGFEIMRRNKGM